MKRKILLLMMTALLSVGAWAENVWSSAEAVTPGGSSKHDVTFPTNLTTNDVIKVTVNITNQWWYHIQLCKISSGWVGDILYDIYYENEGPHNNPSISGNHTLEIPVTADIISEIETASGALTFYGAGYEMTSVDIERYACGYTLLENADIGYHGQALSCRLFLEYATTNDVIVVTGTKNEEWNGNVTIQNQAANSEAVTYGSGDLGTWGSETPVVIPVTLDMISAASSGLYISGGTYHLTSAKLMFTHAVTIAEGITNGTVTASKSKEVYGETVTLTAAPDAGYALVKPTVTDENSASVAVTDNGNGTYSFTMPATAVTVNATFTSATALSTNRLIIYNKKNGSIAQDEGNSNYRNLWVDDDEYSGWDLSVGRPVTTDEFAGIQVLYNQAYNIKMQVVYGESNTVWTSGEITGESGSPHILSVNFADNGITGVVKFIKFLRKESNNSMIQFKSTDAVSLKTTGASAPTPTSSLTLTYGTLMDSGNASVTKNNESGQQQFEIEEGAGNWAGWIFTLPIPTTLYKGINFNMTSVPESGNGAIEIVYEGGDTQTLKLTTGNNIVNFVHSGNITQIKFNVAGIYQMGTCSASNTYLAKITDAKYATYGAVNDAIDYSKTSGLTAYIAKVEDNQVKLTEVNKVPANTAVVLYADVDESTSYTLTPTAETTEDVDANQLNISDGTVTGSSGSGNIYVLAKKSGVVGFYKLESSTKVLAGKAYLEVPSGNNNAPAFIGFGDGTTGIDEVRSNTEEVRSDYHDLQGRRVAQPTKGLYIVNGKKVIIK